MSYRDVIVHSGYDNETESLSDSGQALGFVEEAIEVSVEEEGSRADVVLSDRLGLSRSFVQRLIKEGAVSCTLKSSMKPSYKVRSGEVLAVKIPPPRPSDIVPEPVDFSVVYEDDQIIVVNKPAGVVVHPSPGHWRGTLVHGLLHRFPDIGSINDVIRPGIVHRLDGTTSGLMVVARNSKSLISLQESFQKRKVDKIYLAMAYGRPIVEKITVNAPIGRDDKNRYRMAVTFDGKDACTDIQPLWNRSPYSFVSCKLHTGRTHQIRVHMRHLGAPLLGDSLYGFKVKKRGLPEDMLKNRVFLHAWKLTIPHPSTGLDISFRSVLPKDLIYPLREILSSKGGLH